MSLPATTQSRLISRLKTSFNPVTQQTLQQLGQPVGQGGPSAPTAAATSTLDVVPRDLVSDTQKLDLLDTVIQELQTPEPLAEIPLAAQPAAPTAQAETVPVAPAPTMSAPTQLDTVTVSQPSLTPVSVNPPAPVPAQPDSTPQPVPDQPATTASISATPSPQPAPAGAAAKESLAASTPVVEAASGIQLIEYEKNHEIPPEVEGYLSKVEDHHNQQPQEVVIAGDTIQLNQAAPLAQKVVILPITPELEAAGQKKSPQWSLRWLVEWSHKIMKLFAGKVVYREL